MVTRFHGYSGGCWGLERAVGALGVASKGEERAREGEAGVQVEDYNYTMNDNLFFGLVLPERFAMNK